jgi:Uma2 family endonuclease
MGNPEPIRLYTVAEYLAMEETAEYRSEYFEGEIFAMAGGTMSHDQIVGDFYRLVGNELVGGPCQPLTSNMKIRIQDSSAYYYPDLSVVCGEPAFEDKKELILKNPVLIVEVLSDSTEGFDRGEKFQRYKQIDSLREYVLITQKKPQIDVLYKTEGGFWRLDSYEGRDDVMELRSLGIKLKLEDIYRRVKFEE